MPKNSYRELAALKGGAISPYVCTVLIVQDGDGEFAYVWQDDAMQVVYHTATLMPNRYPGLHNHYSPSNSPSIFRFGSGLFWVKSGLFIVVVV
jgi:hypothetical protein